MRYSTRTLLVVSTLVAVVCAGFVVSTPGWAIFFFTAALVMALASIVAACVRRGPAQAYWIGFAVFASGYFLLAFYLDGLRPSYSKTDQFREPQLLTTHLLMQAYNQVLKWRPESPFSPPYAQYGTGPPTGRRTNSYRFGGRTYVVNRSGADFAQIGHSVFTLLFGVAGGFFGRVCYCRNQIDPRITDTGEVAV